MKLLQCKTNLKHQKIYFSGETIPMTNSEVKCNARAGPGGSLTDCFKAPFTIIRLSFLYIKYFNTYLFK